MNDEAGCLRFTGIHMDISPAQGIVFDACTDCIPLSIRTGKIHVTEAAAVLELSIPALEKAAGMMWNDYEDAVQAATAERIRAAAIVTRNIKDYQQSKIPAFTPAEFLERF